MNNEIVVAFEPYIKSIASKFYNVDYEDLMQAGRLGLQDAYQHYKKNDTTKFSTFAYKYIFGEMYKLANSKTIKINRDILKIIKLVDKTKSLLTQRLGRIPSISDIAIYLEIDENTINYALSQTNSILSLDEEENNDSNLYNKISFNEDNDLKIDIQDSLANLSTDEYQVIKHLYFDSLTQEETAKMMNISQVKISRYKTKSLNKMYNYLNVA
jgi:RNA polymerase sigma factor (sigma-70 family)